jgi:hypothetical protein
MHPRLEYGVAVVVVFNAWQLLMTTGYNHGCPVGSYNKGL